MDTSNLTPDFIDKAKGLSGADLAKLAEREGVELTDEQLDAISGGWVGKNCPKCGSDRVFFTDGYPIDYECGVCGYRW